MKDATLTMTLIFAASLVFLWQLHEGNPSALWVVDWLAGDVQ